MHQNQGHDYPSLSNYHGGVTRVRPKALLFDIYMVDFPASLSQTIGVQLSDGENINFILWADDIILLSDNKKGLSPLLSELKNYSDLNQLKINTD